MASINIINAKLNSEWSRLEILENNYGYAQDLYNNLMQQLKFAKMNLEILDEQITDAQDNINYMSMEKEVLEQQEEDVETEVVYVFDNDVFEEEEVGEKDDIEEEEIDESEEDYNLDIEVMPRDRKTIKDIMTVREAIKSRKSSRHAKLKPRSVKRDRTKSPEQKRVSKTHKKSHEDSREY